jgi:hypothetical protein
MGYARRVARQELEALCGTPYSDEEWANAKGRLLALARLVRRWVRAAWFCLAQPRSVAVELSADAALGVRDAKRALEPIPAAFAVRALCACLLEGAGTRRLFHSGSAKPAA